MNSDLGAEGPQLEGQIEPFGIQIASLNAQMGPQTSPDLSRAPQTNSKHQILDPKKQKKPIAVIKESSERAFKSSPT